jgi:hypothetical protein
MSRYDEEDAEIRRRAHREELKILVWGPGNPGVGGSPKRRRAYQKRIQIRDELRRRFPNSEVFFSEDPEMRHLTADLGGQLRKEALQAYLSDVIIILDVSRGADLELDHFVPTYPWFARKVHVLLPEKYVGGSGLVNEVFDYVNKEQVQGFTQAEWKACTVASEKAMKPALWKALEMLLERGDG